MQYLTRLVKAFKNPKIILTLTSIIILLAFPNILTSSYVLHLMILILMYTSLSEAWNIIAGYAGAHSFGHVAFFGLGAYVTAVLMTVWELSPYIGSFIGGFVAAAVALTVGYPCLKLRGPFFSVATVGINGALYAVFINLEMVGGAKGISLHMFVPEVYTKVTYYYMFLIAALATVFFVYLIESSNFGLALTAIRDDEDAAGVMGIPTFKFKISAFIISAFITAVIGGFYSYYMFFVDPETVFNLKISISFILMTLLGGPGTVLGPVIGAIIVILLSEALRVTIIFTHELVLGLLLIAVVLFVPGGIMEKISSWRRFRSKKYQQAITS